MAHIISGSLYPCQWVLLNFFYFFLSLRMFAHYRPFMIYYKTMSAAIVAIFVAVPCALGVWLWWSMRKIDGKRTAYSSCKAQRPPQTFGKIPEASARVDRVERPPRDSVPIPQGKPSPYTMQAGDVALAFRVGNRYYDNTKNRVFECIALKGKKARLVAFGCLDSVEKDLAFLKECPEFGGFHKVRTDGCVETCQRGALRADRQATEKEVADELEFLRQLRKRESA